jgi:hypothetical protein
MKLRVLVDYQCRNNRYFAGQILQVDDEYGAWLQRDCSGCFERADQPKEEARDVSAPPKDKMMRRSKTK